MTLASKSHGPSRDCYVSEWLTWVSLQSAFTGLQRAAPQPLSLYALFCLAEQIGVAAVCGGSWGIPDVLTPQGCCGS